MKKRYIILIIAIVIVLIAAVSVVSYYIIEEKGKEYEIDEIKQYNYFVLRQNELYGVINRNGDIVIEPQYGKVVIPNPEKAVFVCYNAENTKVLNEKSEEILKDYSNISPIKFDNISSSLMYEKSVLKYEQDGKYGLINFEGKILAKPIYDSISSLQNKEGELLVKQDEKAGVINIKGNELIKPQYDEILIDEYYTNDDGYKYSGYIVGIKTQDGYRYGYLDNKRKKVLELEYNEITRVNEDISENDNDAYLICAKNGQYGVNKNKENIISNEYQSIEYDANNKLFVIEKSKKYGMANIEGKIIVPIQYNQIDITGIYLYAQNEQGTTVYNTDGTQANIDANVSIINTSNEKYKIKIDNDEEQGTKYGVISQKGEQLIEEKYNYIKYLYDNYFIASYENGKLGVIDDKENIKIEMDKDSLQQVDNTKVIQTTLSPTKTIRIIFKYI